MVRLTSHILGKLNFLEANESEVGASESSTLGEA